jgi:hypothetical protein
MMILFTVFHMINMISILNADNYFNLNLLF